MIRPAFTSWRRWPRPWRIAAWAVLGVYALYLLAGNVFLNTPLFEQAVNRQPRKFTLATGPALTLWPGQVLAWDVRVHGHTRHTAWTVDAHRASTRVALWPLLRREVRLPWLEARAVRADVQQVADFVAPPPEGDSGWTLRFDALASDSLQRVRLGRLVLEGHGRGRVGFVKQLKGGPSELLPSQLAFSEARLSWGHTVLLEQGELDSTFSWPRHYRSQAPGLRKLEILQASLRMHGLGSALRVDSGNGTVDIRTVPTAARVYADLRLDKGELAPGSRLVWRTPMLAGVGAPDRGVLTLQLDAAEDLRVQAHLPHDARTDTLVDVDLDVAGRRIPFTDPAALLPRTSGQARVRWQFESLAWIGSLFVAKPWFALEGTGLVDADLRLQQGRLMPGSRLDVPQARARAEVAGMRVEGTAQAHGRLLGDATRQRMHLDVDMSDFSARTGDGQVLVRGNGLDLQLEGAGELPRLRQDLQARLVVKQATVPDLRVYNRYLPRDSVRLLAGTGRFSADLQLDGSGQVGRGQARLQAGTARVQLAGLAMGGDLDLQAHLAAADIGTGHYDLGGSTLALRNVALQGTDAPAPGWWATVRIPAGRVRTGDDFQVDARADIGMRDAGVLLALYSRRSEYPRWIGRVLDAGQVQATGQLRWRRDHLWVDRLQAENDRLSLRARLDLSGARNRGDLYARWGVFGVGVAMDGEQRQWHLLGARNWYDSQPALLPAMKE
jgi:hypothetical protein